MHSAFLPDWLRITWAVLLFGVVIAHAAHISSMSGQRQWWHVGHTVMAAAMMLMYLVPPMSAPVPYRVGLVLFALSAVGVAVVAMVLRRREGGLNPLWVTSCLDMLVMTYMLLPMRAQPEVLSYLFAIYLAATALAWTAGLWKRVPTFRRPLPAGTGGIGTAPPRASGDTALARTAERLLLNSIPGGQPGTRGAPAKQAEHGDGAPTLGPCRYTQSSPGDAIGLAPSSGTSSECTADVPVTLAVMATSMAYMLVVM